MNFINYFKDKWEEFITSRYWEMNYNEIEEYYNEKYPYKDVVYKRTDKLGEQNIDVRIFANPTNFQLPFFQNSFTEDDDTTAIESLKWIIKNIKYKSDINTYKKNEYWAYGYETLKSKQGDCEDGAILLYQIMRNNLIPAWKIRISAGWVYNPNTFKKVGHAYVTYYCESEDRWVDLDWCFFPQKISVSERPDYKDNPIYGKVWFSFNEDYAWSTGLNADAKRYLKQ